MERFITEVNTIFHSSFREVLLGQTSCRFLRISIFLNISNISKYFFCFQVFLVFHILSGWRPPWANRWRNCQPAVHLQDLRGHIPLRDDLPGRGGHLQERHWGGVRLQQSDTDPGGLGAGGHCKPFSVIEIFTRYETALVVLVVTKTSNNWGIAQTEIFINRIYVK